jgi:hypothetical protein
MLSFCLSAAAVQVVFVLPQVQVVAVLAVLSQAQGLSVKTHTP